MMFVKKFFVVFVLFVVNISAQNNLFESYKNNPNYEFRLLKDSTVEILDKQKNFSWKKTIKKYPYYENTTEADLIITLDTVNFANYDDYYRYWGNISANNSSGKYISIDANKNGKNEIYIGYIYWADPNPYAKGRIYEQLIDSVFNNIYEYPITNLQTVFDVGYLTNDGLLNVVYRGGNKLYFFKQHSITSYIDSLNFVYSPFPPVYQPNNVTFYDIDGDGNQEIIYYLFAGDSDSTWAYSNHIAKYNPQINNYELIYYNRPQPDWYTNGISVGDFDQDGKGNFATGSIFGKFYVYEYVQGTEYKVEFTKELEIYNAYLTTMTDDMDGNGKPEIWIGGDFSSSIYGGVTRLFAFEPTGNGSYQQVYQIDIRGLFSAIDGKLRYAELDGDGSKELFLTNANLAFGFKYNNNGNYYMDFVKTMPWLDSIYTYQELERVDLADIDGDGIVEIIPQYELNRGWQGSTENRSVFLKRDKLTNIDDENTIYPSEFNIFQNYPNPFNPETKIKFTTSLEAEVKIKVYNTLGKEIKELLNKTRSCGEHEITWNGTDNFGERVSSGVYFITMEAVDLLKNELPFRKTIKSILLK